MLRLCRSSIAPITALTCRVRWRVSDSSAAELANEIDEANERCLGQVLIDSAGDRGYGLFASKGLTEGDLVIQGRALSLSTERESHSIQTDHNKHAIMDLPARFVNHVCGIANLGIKDNDLGAYDFFALRNIDRGEELTWDYETAEYEIAGFDCTCGSPVCRRKLRGYRCRSRAELVKEAYGDDFIASYLLENTSSRVN